MKTYTIGCDLESPKFLEQKSCLLEGLLPVHQSVPSWILFFICFRMANSGSMFFTFKVLLLTAHFRAPALVVSSILGQLDLLVMGHRHYFWFVGDPDVFGSC